MKVNNIIINSYFIFSIRVELFFTCHLTLDNLLHEILALHIPVPADLIFIF